MVVTADAYGRIDVSKENIETAALEVAGQLLKFQLDKLYIEKLRDLLSAPLLGNGFIVLFHFGTWVKLLAQIKIVAPDETIEKFKRIVLAKHGKLELSAEGEEALKLYIKKYERLLGGMVPPEEDPLKNICAIGRSKERHNVLKDLELMEAGEL